MSIEVNREVQLQLGDDGLLTVWIESVDRSVNVFDENMISALEAAVTHIEQNAMVRAVVFRSRKSGCFFAGADVVAIASLISGDTARAIIDRGQRLMQRIENLSAITVAVIDGACMGGGLEFVLACSYRLASDSSRTKIALPEIRLGLIPGWGGTQRLPKLVGLRQALKMILGGTSVDASRAKQIGLVDQLLVREESAGGDMDAQVYRFVKERLSATNRPRPAGGRWWDWLLDRTVPGRALVLTAARRKIANQIAHYPALPEAIRAVSLAGTIDRGGYQFEREAFSRLLFTATAQNLLRLFNQRDRAKKSTTWLSCSASSLEPAGCRRIAIVGAGAMGAGIGVLAAKKGYEVVFKEVTPAAAHAGSERIAQLLDSRSSHVNQSADDIALVEKRITMTIDWQDLADCDLAIEAAVEVESVKQQVFRQLDCILPPVATLASNTSSLNVTQMAMSTNRRSQVAGLHFFNPVERMELVEVVRTELTDDATVAQLLELVRRLGKTPIVTSDKPGFLVNRVLFPYLGEAVRMVAEGVDVKLIDRDMKRFGMPMGPLELIDRVGVDIASHVASSLRSIQADAEIPAAYLADMKSRNWLGKKSGIGFYVWGKKHSPNKSLAHPILEPEAAFGFEPDSMSNIQRRLVYPMLNEAVHCLDEMVVTDPWVVDLGMVLGTGFAPMHGGPLRLIDALGEPIVLHNLRNLERTYGKRFAPADGLVRRAARHESFYVTDCASEPLNWESNHESRC